MEHLPRRLIYTVSYTDLCARIAYQVIALHYRKHPDYYGHPPTAILNLAERYRTHPFGWLYWSLRSAATWNAHGISLRQWRDELSLADRDRALHKRKPRRRA